MSLQWTLVAFFLYLEVAVVTLLLLPFISVSLWQRLFKSKILQGISRQANLYFLIFIGILVLFFFDSLRDSTRYSQEKDSEVDHGHVDAEMQLSLRLFRSQRNFYISGFALFLCLVIRRLVTLISEQALLQTNYVASMKQAQSATQTAERLLAEKEQNRDGHREEVENMGNDKKAVLEENITQLRSKLEAVEKENTSLKKNVEAIRSQSEATNTEYDRLMKEHAALQAQAASGDTKKDH